MNTPCCRPRLVYKKKLLAQNTSGIRGSPVFNTLGSLHALVFLLPESFFVNLFWWLFQIHQEVDSPAYSSQGSGDSPVYSSQECRESPVYSLHGSQSSLTFYSKNLPILFFWMTASVGTSQLLISIRRLPIFPKSNVPLFALSIDTIFRQI
jgi:hypothetical protein